MHFFICHYTPLVERNKFIKNQLDNKVGNMVYYNLEADLCNNKVPLADISNVNSINYDPSNNVAFFVRKYDRDYLTKDIISSKFNSPHDKTHNIRLEYHEHPDYNKTFYTYNNFKSKYNHSLSHRGIKPAEMSLALKHYETLKNISQMDISYAMVIEDDCVFVDNFIPRMLNKIKDFPSDWDIYYPNSCPNPGFRTKGGWTAIPNVKELIVKKHPTSVFGISYLITKNAALKIVNELEKNKHWIAIDHEFNWLSYTLQLKVIWNRHHDRLTLWGVSGLKSSLI
tara:strand:- start:7412 stop:8260 length:849 start_codon:yes stop_codon:yes gene_type:complete